MRSFSYTYYILNVVAWWKIATMHRLRKNAYKHVSDFERGQIDAYQECGLSYLSIAIHDGQDHVTVCTVRKDVLKNKNMYILIFSK